MRSTPDYPALAAKAVRSLPGGRKVFAGQRQDAFFVDLGSIFDLGALRPLNSAHLISMPNMNGVNGLQGFNVHSIAIQVPKRDLTRDGRTPTSASAKKSVIGVWATASRRKSRVFDAKTSKFVGFGPWKQVSRLANPLFNEVVIPMAEKDQWNARPPRRDSQVREVRERARAREAAAGALPGRVPQPGGVRQARARTSTRSCSTGIPSGVVPGFQNFTGPVEADMLRLNMAVPPTGEPQQPGAGRRATPPGSPTGAGSTDDVDDDRDPGDRRPDDPAGRPVVHPGRCGERRRPTARRTPTQPTLGTFPYLAPAGGGYQTVPGTTTPGRRPAVSNENPHAGQGAVLLDIGGDVGHWW